MTIHSRFEFKVQDLWVGAFWRTTYCETNAGPQRMATDIWVCLLPCLPLHITIWHDIIIPFR